MFKSIALLFSLTLFATTVLANQNEVNCQSTSEAHNLSFLYQPTNGLSGQQDLNSIVVTVVDACGNIVSAGDKSNSFVSLSIVNNVGGATLLGKVTAKARQGVVLFSNLGIDLPGLGYRLAAYAEDLEPTQSNNFNMYK